MILTQAVVVKKIKIKKTFLKKVFIFLMTLLTLTLFLGGLRTQTVVRLTLFRQFRATSALASVILFSSEKTRVVG